MDRPVVEPACTSDLDSDIHSDWGRVVRPAAVENSEPVSNARPTVRMPDWATVRNQESTSLYYLDRTSQTTGASTSSCWVDVRSCSEGTSERPHCMQHTLAKVPTTFSATRLVAGSDELLPWHAASHLHRSSRLGRSVALVVLLGSSTEIVLVLRRKRAKVGKCIRSREDLRLPLQKQLSAVSTELLPPHGSPQLRHKWHPGRVVSRGKLWIPSTAEWPTHWIDR